MVDLSGRFVPSLYNVECYAGEGRISQTTDGLVVVHTKDGHVLRNADTRDAAELGYTDPLIVIAGEDRRLGRKTLEESDQILLAEVPHFVNRGLSVVGELAA